MKLGVLIMEDCTANGAVAGLSDNLMPEDAVLAAITRAGDEILVLSDVTSPKLGLLKNDGFCSRSLMLSDLLDKGVLTGKTSQYVLINPK